MIFNAHDRSSKEDVRMPILKMREVEQNAESDEGSQSRMLSQLLGFGSRDKAPLGWDAGMSGHKSCALTVPPHCWPASQVGKATV